MFNLLGRLFSEELTSPNEEKKDSLPFEQNTSLVLKRIFRHLSDADLRNARFVDRNWNLAAVAELASREYCPPPIKLHGSFEPSVGSFSWYLDFENSRRSLWTEVYGTGCPVLEFRHLHFIYPEEPRIFFSIAQSCWRDSVTNLTLSLYEFLAEELLINWFLPSFPNVHNLSCIIQADNPETSGTSVARRNYNYCNCKLCPPAGKPDVAKSHEFSKNHCSFDEKKVRQHRKIRSFSVCFEKPCSFPWTVLDSFPMLHNLKLEFGNEDALVKSANDLAASGISLRIIRSFEIILTHSDVEQQVTERGLSPSGSYNRAFLIANAKLCNLFRVYKSLKIATLISATSFFEFLRQLSESWTTELDFEIAVPCNPNNYEYVTRFCRYFVPGIETKFPAVYDLHLQFVQFSSNFSSKTETGFAWSFAPGSYLNLEKLRISTLPADLDSSDGVPQFLTLPICQEYTLFFPWFPKLTELVVDVCNSSDCLAAIDVITAVNLSCLKKLVLRGSCFFLEDARISCEILFPEMDRPNLPKKRWYGASPKMTEQYEGLPGISSLEVFCLEKFGLYYMPSVASEILKIPNFKSIHLDADFNQVISDPATMLQNVELDGKAVTEWPPSVGNTKIFTKNTL